MPTLPRPKLRWRMLAITATVAGVLLAAAWGASFRWNLQLTAPVPGGGYDIVGWQAKSLLWTRARDERTMVPIMGLVPSAVRPAAMWPFRIKDSRGLRAVLIPFWIPTAACALAAFAFWRIDTLHRRRCRPHLCPGCRYDRTGLPAAAPCPECGVAPAPVAASSR